MSNNSIASVKADILIIDDTPDNLRLLNKVLSRHYKVRLAPSGDIGLKATRSTLPDLILLDVMMPGTDGYEVAVQLKADERTTEIPIIFISALDDTESKVRGFAAGGVDYITKPFQEQEVLARVETHLSLRSLYKQVQAELADRKSAEEALRASNANLETLIQVSPLAISLLDPKGNVQLWNTAAEKIFGWTSQEVIGHPNPIVPANKQSEYATWSANILHGKPLTNQETIRQCKDGTLVDVSISSAPIYDDSGNAIGRMAIITDITERKLAEKHLRQLSRAVESSPTSIVITDAKGDIQYVNPKFTELTGHSFSDAVGKNPKILKSDQTPPEAYTELWGAITKGKEWHGEFCNRKKNGALYWESASISPITDENGAITHYVAVKEDITERKRVEENIRRMVDRWSIVYRASEEIGISLDTEQVFAAVHRAMEQVMPCEDFVISLYDETRNEMSGSYILENNKRLAPNPYKADHGLGGHIVHSGQSLILNSPEQIKTSGIRFEPYGDGLITSSVLAVPMQIKGKTIGILSVQSYHSEAYTTEDQELLEMLAGHVAVAIDHARLFEQSQQEIAERKRAEEALKESEEKYHKIFNNEIDAICIFDIQTKKILDVNNAYLKLYGYTREEVLQLITDDISAEPDKTDAAIQKAKAAGDVIIPERSHRKKDGTVFQVELSAGAYNWKGRNVMFAVARDITERKRAEAALSRRNQEMASLYETSLEINALSDISVLLHAIVRRACDLLKMPAGALYLARPEDDSFELVVGYQTPPHWIGTKLHPGEGMAGQIAQTKKVMIVEDYPSWEGRLTAFEDTPAHRVLGAPLIFRDQVMGVIILMDTQAGSFSEEEVRLVSLFADQAAIATRNAQLYQEIQHIASHDVLTGLYNRRYMEDALMREFARATRRKEPLSIIMMDMDGLKKFNDTYGHDLGDLALKTFGNQIKLMARAEDIACRYGGDEFLVILYNTDMKNASRRVAEWHRKMDEVRIPYQDTHLHITFSAGIATYPTQGKTSEEVIKAADKALYRKKRTG